MKCPNCDVELDFYDCIDTDNHNERIIEYIVGGCPKCNTEYQWERVYKFVGECCLEESE